MESTTRKRGRPPLFDRGDALAAATRLFRAQGYEATSIGQLTAAMGLRSGSLYAAFGDKKALFTEVVAVFECSPVGGFVHAALEDEATAVGAATRILRDAAALFTSPDAGERSLTYEARSGAAIRDAEVARLIRQLRQADVDAMSRRFARARDEGELPEDADPQLLSAFVATILHGLAARAAEGAPTTELLEMVELALSGWPGGSAHSVPRRV
ncbi:TetR/AcrR family transcriptional regulator [Schumannella luteola]|uniref:AcrR family transcriptional regulator n=1 Tax=Schumannella luteola TaxID=472059 RepID=A0A852Y685_9MICO|nr:TetR/AcrR family transcriptional regulator [Schumannella luteola]NYG98456.1 AcrR family transcriptional regulator [Schumannella luteola]TPX01313.1 TetR/AcrR family transcriptional regulator [Schumannella luteola]